MKTDRHEYYRGQKGKKYGIYNTKAKRFQFGICEDTPMLAEARLFQMIGDDARKYRFEPRALPPDGKTAGRAIIDELPKQELKEKAKQFLKELAPETPSYAVEIAAEHLATMRTATTEEDYFQNKR